MKPNLGPCAILGASVLLIFKFNDWGKNRQCGVRPFAVCVTNQGLSGGWGLPRGPCSPLTLCFFLSFVCIITKLILRRGAAVGLARHLAPLTPALRPASLGQKELDLERKQRTLFLLKKKFWGFFHERKVPGCVRQTHWDSFIYFEDRWGRAAPCPPPAPPLGGNIAKKARPWPAASEKCPVDWHHGNSLSLFCGGHLILGIRMPGRKASIFLW